MSRQCMRVYTLVPTLPTPRGDAMADPRKTSTHTCHRSNVAPKEATIKVDGRKFCIDLQNCFTSWSTLATTLTSAARYLNLA